jgi:hypothetical protein
MRDQQEQQKDEIKEFCEEMSRMFGVPILRLGDFSCFAGMQAAKLDTALRACTLLQAVKHCMMFHYIHDDTMVKEVLEKHGAASVQLLAKMAQDAADEALDSNQERINYEKRPR